MTIFKQIMTFLKRPVYFGRHPDSIPDNSIVFFPYLPAQMNCGLSGIVAFKQKKIHTPQYDWLTTIDQLTEQIEANQYAVCVKNYYNLKESYLGGKQVLALLWKTVRSLHQIHLFFQILNNGDIQEKITSIASRLKKIIDQDEIRIKLETGKHSSSDTKAITLRMEDLKDICWSIQSEIINNVKKVQQLMPETNSNSYEMVSLYRYINAVLNSIDRLEVRGRDSAGISLLFILKKETFQTIESILKEQSLWTLYQERQTHDILLNQNIVKSITPNNQICLAFVYKIAAEVGRLGDNVEFIRNQISNDVILHNVTSQPIVYHTILAHTRWASVGAINEVNCHPQDNQHQHSNGIIHVCLNGDIDNYLNLKSDFEKEEGSICLEITTDTKIIPLIISKYIKQGFPVKEAIRLAVNQFEGSHAISVHTDLSPGKLYLAQKGSGQSIFIGISEEHYMSASEMYGIVEETSNYIKLDGETIVQGKYGPTQGQLFELCQESTDSLEGIRAWYYDGTPIDINKDSIKQTQITSRDIDRQGFAHYFLKEISESPISVEKTLYNRWKIEKVGNNFLSTVFLDQTVVPEKIINGLIENKIERIFFIGQGTAGVAAQACADILKYYFGKEKILISAQKASEFSGFMISEDDRSDSLSNTLLIAISQSGTTTDTNRAVDMVRSKGAYTIAIVNRRDSDLSFKVEGVMYTSSGRDIEMSVASTKAFYSQIVAGALLGLYFVQVTKKRNPEFIANEIQNLIDLPEYMRKVLSNSDEIMLSAKKLACEKNYWATVGSGPNKASADEIRIKLSELCYKTISSDYVEDKKHIDLSSEPLIIVCAAGSPENVLPDIIKDTAIFKAHKAIPVVIANVNEERFIPYADNIIYVPKIPSHLSPILNTLAGHLWGYYAALTINDSSRFLFEFKEDIHQTIAQYIKKEIDLYEVLLEKTFREKIIRFYSEFRTRKKEHNLPLIMGLEIVSDLTLLLKYLSGRLPVRDFELDFGIKGTPSNMLNALFECLNHSINNMARPIDAIKHQAKTVTVGTSRLAEKMEGLLFEFVEKRHSLAQLTHSNVLVLKNLQRIIENIKGYILYKVGGLNLLGEPTDDSYLEVIEKDGSSLDIESRVETDKRLKGTKRIIIDRGNIYIGKGRLDERSILAIPINSGSAARSHIIEFLLLLNISFKQDVPLFDKLRALGGKYNHIKQIVQESNIIWQDDFLNIPIIEDLFGLSAEKLSEKMIAAIKNRQSLKV